MIHMLLAAVLFSLHHWVAIAKSRGDYSPFAPPGEVSSLTTDETWLYAPFAGRFMWLGQLVAEVDNYERRHSSAGVPFFPAAVLGAMGRLLGKLEWAFISADVVFPALALGLLYVTSASIVQSTGWRLLLAWATLLIPFGPRNFLWRGYDALIAAPDFTRTPQPEVSFTVLLIGLLLTARGLRGSSMGGAAVAGFAAALIVYSYYFYAIGWGITLGMLFVLSIMWRKWAAAKRAAVMLIVMIAASAPYIVATVRGMVEGGQTDLLSRTGMYTHAPRLMPLLLYAAGSFLVWKFCGRLLDGPEHQVRIVLLLLLLLAGLAGLNFQVLSGFDATHEKHFWNRLIQPVGFFLAGCWLLTLAQRHKQNLPWAQHAVAGTLVLVVLNAGARQLYAGNWIAKHQRATRPEIELVAWVHSHVPAGTVIGTLHGELTAIIPALAPNFNYVPMKERTLTPIDEILSRCYELALLVHLSDAEIEALMASPDHSPPPQLRLDISTCDGTPASFSEYIQAQHDQAGKLNYRLDYIVDRSGRPMPARVATGFTHAAIIYMNERYQLIRLGERREGSRGPGSPSTLAMGR